MKMFLTKPIYEKLVEIDKSKKFSYLDKQKQIQDFIISLYVEDNICSIQDIIDRKTSLQSKLSSQSSIFETMGLAIFVWMALEGIKQCVLSLFEKNNALSNILYVSAPAIFAILVCFAVSLKLGKEDALYRKYNLIDFELRIIDAILEANFHYDDIIQNIVTTRSSHHTLITEMEETPKDLTVKHEQAPSPTTDIDADIEDESKNQVAHTKNTDLS